MRQLATTLLCLVLSLCAFARASGGPFGIDHRLHYDNSGIWKRSVQVKVEYATALTVIGGSLVLGDHDRAGDTFWRSLDAVAFSTVAAQAMKLTFQRERPIDTSDPNRFFKGAHNDSFPSGEVTMISAAVTPFVVNYGHDHPAVYALELLPVYDAIARMKVRGHWQSDVLAGAALGTGIGLWASHTRSPIILGWLPGGFQVGLRYRF
jgi:undecaprenyl-diphosphatase